MRTNRFITAALCGAAVSLIAACGGGGQNGTAQSGAVVAPASFLQQDAKGIPYEILPAALAQSEISEKRLVAVRDAEAWKSLWAEHAGTGSADRPAPEIDFSRNTVIGVFLGSRGACDRVAVTAVKQRAQSQRLEVTYEVLLPPPDTACIASIANPAVLVTVPLSGAQVDFVQAPARAESDLVVKSGWSFGMCLEKCDGTVQIAKDGASFRSGGGKDGAALPEQGIWGAVSEKEWEALQAGFGSVPDVVIGCPDCADEGREWIEISRGATTKRVEFSCKAQLDAAPGFLATVRAIRGRLAAALGLPDPCNPATIAFERIAPAMFTSEIAEKRFVAIRDAAAWAALWNEHSAGRAPLPAVDFTQQMVVGVFLGRESVPCGGLSIDTVRKANEPEQIEVGYRVVDPGPDVMCIAAVINQYALVTIPASTLPVNFVKLP
ncbi:MAG TPA: hypothetical protein VEC01_07065 [Noviherbaspirillum sp.]|uniref:hypothetical protein n=1 Tax=Noviherbaspirillum sp. TaxID=1926288 RepID=UPI002D565DA1|nr:hypothetical protein [Noviherbaspirillum sp.]HYD95066.1 hypothetical protein [Noviherbaspirillum sp.]